MPFDATPRKVNETSEGLRRMAEIFRRDGYSPCLCDGKSGCFLSTIAKYIDESGLKWHNDARRFMKPLQGNESDGFFADSALIAAGYPADPTGEKAAQLCERVAAELELA